MQDLLLVDPLNKGHIGTSHFVQVVLFSGGLRSRMKMLLEMIILGHYKLSFIERLSSSRRVLYQRFHYSRYHPLMPLLC